jgi:serine/threonine-protein kinase
MAFDEGTHLGSYEITGRIGAGGMGEVYRALDTRLDRPVAIKTLPDAVAQDPERLTRFEREAKLLAALNHANIAAVYGLDEHAGMKFIAMELIEGETLEETLKRGPLAVEEALSIAIQVAEALEAAHAKGVVHRDLKPANIMLTGDGQVKVLDFGLAKALSGGPDDASAAHSPALSLAMTQQGLILGTAGYMSPEQASGQAADQRADVWAFGVVLYEMLTGQPVFSGESVPHILAAILQKEPDWTELPKGLHPRLRPVLGQCLEKKLRNRYHSIADVRIELAGIASAPDAANEAVVRASPRAMPLGAATMIGGALAGLAAWVIWPEPEAAPVERFVDVLPQSQVFRNVGRRVIAMSPTGSHYVYNTPNGLFLRRMDEAEAQLIPGTEGTLTSPTFSPNGQALAYWDANQGEIVRIDINGGAPIGLAEATNPHGMSWGEDGTLLIGQPEGILQVSANGASADLLIAAEDGEQLFGPTLLPDAESVLFSVAAAPNWDSGQIVAESLTTGERTTLVEGGSDARLLPTGHLVYALEDTLRATRFDASELRVRGATAALVQGVMRGGNNTGVAQYSVSANGGLVYVPEIGGANQVLVWVDEQGTEEMIDLPPDQYTWVRLSPDETRAAIQIEDGGNAEIWVSELDRGTLEPITNNPAVDRTPLWTPDGERIVFVSDRESGVDLYVRDADGRGPVEHLTTIEGAEDVRLFGWSPDENAIVFEYAVPGTAYDVGTLSLSDEPAWRPLLSVNGVQGSPAVSPDGNWFAYNSNETGQFQVYIERYPNGGQRRAISTAPDLGASPVWSNDSRSIFYQDFSGNGAMKRVSLDDPTLSAQTLFEGAYALPVVGRNWDVAADGERFLLTRAATNTVDEIATEKVVVVRNWFTDVERRTR